MKLSFLPSVLVLLAGVARAASPAAAQFHTRVCQTTQLKTKPKTSPRTRCSTTTTRCSACTTVDRTVTVTPSPFTTTRSRTVTVTVTGVATTNTATTTTTSTLTTTNTGTVLVTDTAITTVISGTSTSTIPADPTFLPIADTIPGATHDIPAQGGRRRRGTTPNPAARGTPLGLLGSGQQRQEQTYPGDVQCYEYYGRCTTSTATRTHTRTAARPTRTATAVVTSTATTTPGVSATITRTASTTEAATATATQTVTVTSTTTLPAATATFYAACGLDNLARYVDGYKIFTGQPDYDVVDNVPGANESEYDCCVQALLHPLAAYFAYILPNPRRPGNCQILVSRSTCAASRASLATAYLSDTRYEPPVFAFGNANCGQWTLGLGPLP